MTIQVGNPQDPVEIAIERLIKPFEGYHKALPDGSCQAYTDPIGIWTIGWGSIWQEDGSKVTPGLIWSRQYAEKMLRKEALHFQAGVLKSAPNLAKEPVRQAGVISWAFNLGLGAFRASTFRKRLLEENWEGAYSECLRWNKADGKVLRGLTLRREAEGLLIRYAK